MKIEMAGNTRYVGKYQEREKHLMFQVKDFSFGKRYATFKLQREQKRLDRTKGISPIG